MRIGFVTGEYPPLQGGIGAHVDVLSRVMTGQGHDIFIFSEQRAQQQHDNIPLTAFERDWGYGAQRAINQWAKTHHLDIVNLHFQTAAFAMSPWVHFMPRFVEQPFVTTFHDLRFPYLFPKAGRLRDWIVMHLAKASDGVIVTNHEDYTRVKHLPCVEVIPIGSSILADIPPDFDRASWRAKVKASEDHFLLAHFGFINHSKGVDTLLRALASLNNPCIKLLMVGGRTGTADPTNATYADTIDALIADLNLSEQIAWTGFVDDSGVSAYLRAADAVALPFRDGASYRRSSLMAVIHHGCAIITTQPAHDISAFNDDNMLLVPPENPAALADAIRTLQTTPSLQTQLREGTEQLKREFDWQTIADNTLALFERVIGER